MKDITSFIYEYRTVEFLPNRYYLGELFYSIEDDDLVADLEDDGDTKDTESNKRDDIMYLIKHWLSYPEDSYYYDCKFANDQIPIFYVFKGDPEDDELEILDEGKFYIAKEDEKYKDKIKKLIGETKNRFIYLRFDDFDIELI